jgi:hypothetical protein
MVHVVLRLASVSRREILAKAGRRRRGQHQSMAAGLAQGTGSSIESRFRVATAHPCNGGNPYSAVKLVAAGRRRGVPQAITFAAKERTRDLTQAC